MDTFAMIFLGVMLLIFISLDIGMIVSLLKPGDERKQMIVWKTSAYTLLVSVGATVLGLIENIVRGHAISTNPFIQLGVTAVIYFIALMFFKKKHGG